MQFIVGNKDKVDLEEEKLGKELLRRFGKSR